MMTAAAAQTVSADSVDDIFNKAGKWENATSVKIPKFFVRLGLFMGKADHLPGKVDGVRVLDIEDVTQAKAALLSGWLSRITSDGKLQEAVKTTQNGEKTSIWFQYDGKTIKRIVIADMEKDQFSLVEVKGCFTEQDLRKLTEEND